MRLGVYVVMAGAALAGCAAPPLGPLVQVLPGPNKSFDQFQFDDGQCRSFASYQTAGQAQAVNGNAVGGALLTTVLGTGLGAIVGGGRGAAVGAVSGAGVGVGLGALSSSGTQGGIQAQYDGAYAQCMYARGNQVPGLPLAPAYAAAGYPPGYASGYGAAPASVAAPDGLVQATQQELTRLGFLRGPVDGIDGPRTTDAVRTFQAAQGYPPDGVISPALLERMRNTRVSY